MLLICKTTQESYPNNPQNQRTTSLTMQSMDTHLAAKRSARFDNRWLSEPPRNVYSSANKAANACLVAVTAVPPGRLDKSHRKKHNTVTFDNIQMIFTVDFVPEKTSVTRRPVGRKPSHLTKDCGQRGQKTCPRCLRCFGGFSGPFFAALAALRLRRCFCGSLRLPRGAGLGPLLGF